jgi:hypothetical protein
VVLTFAECPLQVPDKKVEEIAAEAVPAKL